jgi:hypothetical protein
MRPISSVVSAVAPPASETQVKALNKLVSDRDEQIRPETRPDTSERAGVNRDGAFSQVESQDLYSSIVQHSPQALVALLALAGGETEAREKRSEARAEDRRDDKSEPERQAARRHEEAARRITSAYNEALVAEAIRRAYPPPPPGVSVKI